MKLLAIDAGNTRIKWGLHDGAAWVERGALPTAELSVRDAQSARWRSAERVIIANVAGQNVAQALQACVGAPARFVVSQAEQCGVRSSYADPSQLGSDRWAALIGARKRCASACAVVGAGTTMTVDALSADGIFLGGFIVPGFELMRGALASHTANLARRDGAFSFFPDTTGDAIVSGAVNALCGAIERMCRHLAEAADADPVVILSGGDGPLIAKHLGRPADVVDNLVLEGLLCIGLERG